MLRRRSICSVALALFLEFVTTSALAPEDSSILLQQALLGAEGASDPSDIDALVVGIERDVETAIKADRDKLQKRLDDAVVDLTKKKKIVTALKSATVTKDNSLLQCRMGEQASLKDTATELAEIVRLRDETAQVCNNLSTHRTLKWSLSAANGGCDMKLDTNCTATALANEIGALRKRVDDSRKLYFQKKSACEKSTVALQELLTGKAVERMMVDKFLLKKGQCDETRQRALVSMCMFGHRLREYCHAKAELHELVNGTGDGLRKTQWDEIQGVKCLLKALKSGNPSADAACKSSIDFQKDVGKVDVSTAKDLVSGAATDALFSCATGEKITFSGFRWKTGETPADYVKEDYAPKINLTATYPFEFCALAPSPYLPPAKVPQPQVASPDIARPTIPVPAVPAPAKAATTQKEEAPTNGVAISSLPSIVPVTSLY